MTKTAAIITQSPLRFIAGTQVFAEDLKDVMQAMNYACCESPEVFFSFVAGGPGWDRQTAPNGAYAGLGITRVGSVGAWLTGRCRTPVRFRAEHLVCTFGVQVNLYDDCVARVRLQIDGVTAATLNIHPADDGQEVRTNIALADLGGAGEHTATLDLQIYSIEAGATGIMELVTARLQRAPLDPTGLPDPSG